MDITTIKDVLNLAYPEKSSIKYKISKYPDGQQNVNILCDDDILNFLKKNVPILIKSRLNNWLDLELITAAVASLRELEFENLHLYCPYVVGARSDRKFSEGGNNYLKNVICPAINVLNLKSFTCLDPHSNCLEMGITNFKKISNLELVQHALSTIYSPHGLQEQNFVLISPDAGAAHKIMPIVEAINYKGEIIICTKERDENGKLNKVVIPVFDPSNKDVIIIDDIADGGRTFINIASKLLPHKSLNHSFYLFVTHGIFSAGIEALSPYFGEIYCTNSYSDETHKIVNQIDVF